MDTITWNLIDEGVSKRMINLDENCENRLIRVECYPKDEKREGISVETVAVSPVLKRIDKEKLPMTQRHMYTQNILDNKKIRVLTWNILSKSNCDRNKVYLFCSKKYLDFNYRKILIIKELIGYNADIIFMQECEIHFYNDLKMCFPDYSLFFKQKSHNINDGGIVMFRSDRFRFINSFDINIDKEYENNYLFGNLKSAIQKHPILHDHVKKKGSVAQIMNIQFISNPKAQLLL
ncbi:2 -5 -phosphodiesterase 12, partial [Brachionus plicatilis]